ncbi:hypothetical protein RCL1_006402 [Eukaryota sp. TZLM3-RCL]
MGNTAIRRAFERLDVHQKGYLTLDQIMSAQSFPGVAAGCSHSLLTLAFFDKSQTGSLDLEEFSNLVRHLQTINPSVGSRLCSCFCLRSCLRSASLPPDLTPSHSMPELPLKNGKALFNSQWSHSVEHVSFVPDSSSSTSKTSRRPSSVGIGLTDDEITVTPTSPLRVDQVPPSDPPPDALVSHFLRSTNSESDSNIWLQLQQSLECTSERQRIIEWMYKLVSYKGDATISNDELGKFLAIVNFDGIPLTSLLFSSESTAPCNQEAVPLRIREVLNEFDLTGDGKLSKAEFFRLADLVLSEFELTKSRSMKVLSKIGRYVVSRTLGFGAQAVVKLAFDPVENEYRAVKIIKKSNEAAIASVENEVKALSLLNHSNIIKLFNVIESDDFVFLILELASGGTLSDYFTTMPSDEATVRYYFKQIVNALEQCHSKGIVHRDLRMENLLVDEYGCLKMNDFGHAGFFKNTQWDLFSTTDAGSIYHLCPEQCKNQPYSGRSRDMWSLGVVLYSLLTRKRPFYSNSIPQLVTSIINGIYTIPTDMSVLAADLVGRLLSLNPEERPLISQVKLHPFMWGEENIPALALGDVEIPRVLLTKRCVDVETKIWFDIKKTCQSIGLSFKNESQSASYLSPCLFKSDAYSTEPDLKISIKWCRRACSLCAFFPTDREITIEHLILLPSVDLTLGDHALPACQCCSYVIKIELKKGHSWSFHKLYFRIRTALNGKFETLEKNLYKNAPALEESQHLSQKIDLSAKNIKPKTLHMREISLLFSNNSS